MNKIDYKKELKHLYKPSPQIVEIVEGPLMNFIMIDGKGDPNTAPEFGQAIEVLYSLSYTLKFMIKKGEIGIDYGVLPLEGLWWADDMTKFNVDDKSNWKWTVMIMQPEYITMVLFEEALSAVEKKKDLVLLSEARFESFEEGKAAQIMHIGPFSEEGPAIKRIHDFIEERGYTRMGRHHEIYLSDIRKAAPEKWKTIIRQPIR
jgi:hypothetical protein